MLICAAQYEAFAKIYDRVFGFSRPTRILLLGLDAAGKTSVLYKPKLDELVTTIPTIGFNVEELNYKNLSMTMWDVGGQDKIRRLWSHYYENSDAIVYVIDSNDRDRLSEARDELHKMLDEDQLRNASLLVLCNKQDLPSAMSPSAVSEGLGLRALRRDWYIQACSAVSGDGIFEGLEWLSQTLKKKPARVAAGA